MGCSLGWDADKAEYQLEAWKVSEEQDRTLENPRCVFQVLKRHYARYTPEMVEEICGITPELFRKIAETICNNSGRERTTSILLRGGLDASSNGAADDSGGFDCADFAGEHRASGRRDTGAARAYFDSGVDRYSDVV